MHTHKRPTRSQESPANPPESQAAQLPLETKLQIKLNPFTSCFNTSDSPFLPLPVSRSNQYAHTYKRTLEAYAHTCACFKQAIRTLADTHKQNSNTFYFPTLLLTKTSASGHTHFANTYTHQTLLLCISSTNVHSSFFPLQKRHFHIGAIPNGSRG